MATVSKTTVSVSDDSFTLDTDHGNESLINTSSTKTEADSSFHVRPNEVTTVELDSLEKEDGKIHKTAEQAASRDEIVAPLTRISHGP